MRKRKTPAELYSQYAIRKHTGCIEWHGAQTKDGYGIITFWKDGRRTSTTAHRMAYEMAHGPVGEDICVMHSCDNPACVNVDHLSLGTQLDNIQDCISKGRANFWGKSRLAG